MTPAQTALVARRNRAIRQWPAIGIVVTVLVIALYVFALRHLPIEARPAVLAAQVKAGQLSLEGMGHLVIIGSIAFLACGVFILSLLAVVSLSLFNEKRLIDIVQAQEAELNALRPPPATPAEGTADAAAADTTPGDGV